MLGFLGFVHIHVLKGLHEITGNNQAGSKHNLLKFHPFKPHSIAWHTYKSIQPETCFEKL